MKRILLLALLLLALGCGKSDNAKTEQDVRLSGYSYAYGKQPQESLRFLFFPADNGEQYVTEAYQLPEELNLYDFSRIEEDPIYTLLMEENSIRRTDGTIVQAKYVDTSTILFPVVDETIITLPIGKYFVVALCDVRHSGGLMNKYATTDFTVEAKDYPLPLVCVMYSNYSQYGRVPWH